MLFFRMMEIRAARDPEYASPLHSLAEHEACLLIIKHSCFSVKLANAYRCEDVIKTFKNRIREAKQAIREEIIKKRATQQLQPHF